MHSSATQSILLWGQLRMLPLPRMAQHLGPNSHLHQLQALSPETDRLHRTWQSPSAQ